MTDFRINSDGDLDLVGHQIVLVEGDEAIRQQIQIRCKFFLGEFFLDQQVGIPYYRNILRKNPNLDVVRDIFRQAIRTTPQVARVSELDVSIDAPTRTLNVTFKAIIDTGEELVFEPFTIEI